jgi:hypothetical protein
MRGEINHKETRVNASILSQFPPFLWEKLSVSYKHGQPMDFLSGGGFPLDNPPSTNAYRKELLGGSLEVDILFTVGY